MQTNDASQLEEHLLRHYLPSFHEEESSDKSAEDAEKKGDVLLLTPQRRSRAADEIHFLVDEIQNRLDRDMERVMFALQHPLAGKNVRLLLEFTKHVIHAQAQQMHLEQERQQRATRPVQERPLKNKTPLPATVPAEPALPAPPVPMKPAAPPPLILATGGPTFPEMPSEDQYELSALDAERAAEQGENQATSIIHIPLMLDEESQEIVASADCDEGAGLYTLTEPLLDDVQTKLLHHLKQEINDTTLLRNQRELQRQIKKAAKKLNVDTDDQDYFVLKYYLVRDLALAGPVTALLNDSHITTITCDGPGTPISIIRENKKVKTNVFFQSRDDLNAFLIALGKNTFQKVDIDTPVLDATFRHFRIQGTLGTDIVPSRFLMTRI